MWHCNIQNVLTIFFKRVIDIIVTACLYCFASNVILKQKTNLNETIKTIWTLFLVFFFFFCTYLLSELIWMVIIILRFSNWRRLSNSKFLWDENLRSTTTHLLGAYWKFTLSPAVNSPGKLFFEVSFPSKTSVVFKSVLISGLS